MTQTSASITSADKRLAMTKSRDHEITIILKGRAYVCTRVLYIMYPLNLGGFLLSVFRDPAIPGYRFYPPPTFVRFQRLYPGSFLRPFSQHCMPVVVFGVIINVGSAFVPCFGQTSEERFLAFTPISNRHIERERNLPSTCFPPDRNIC